jgi:hypothetical protein
MTFRLLTLARVYIFARERGLRVNPVISQGHIRVII